MSFLLRALRTNPHLLNFVLVSGAVMAPVLLYVEYRGPTQAQVQTVLVSTLQTRGCGLGARFCAPASLRLTCFSVLATFSPPPAG